jgi:hypothetical protein
MIVMSGEAMPSCGALKESPVGDREVINCNHPGNPPLSLHLPKSII